MNRYLLAIVIIAIITWLAMPVPVKVSPLPPAVQVEPPFLPPTFKGKVRHPKRCIFVEPEIGPWCRYDDRAMVKVGRDGVKPYAVPEVNTEDNVGY